MFTTSPETRKKETPLVLPGGNDQLSDGSLSDRVMQQTQPMQKITVFIGVSAPASVYFRPTFSSFSGGHTACSRPGVRSSPSPALHVSD